VKPTDVTIDRSSAVDPETIAPSAQVILDAAEALFGQRGYAATSVSAICATSALPVGSIYHHFENKLAILSAVLDRAARRFFTELDDAAGTRLEPERRMRKYYEQAPKLIAHNANYLRILAATLQQDGDEKLLAFARQAADEAAASLAAIIEPVAAAAGVRDPAALSLELAQMTNNSSLGAAIIAGYDAQLLRKRLAPLYELIHDAINKAATQAKGSRRKVRNVS
jgi:AcrR family transcriptional regulator